MHDLSRAGVLHILDSAGANLKTSDHHQSGPAPVKDCGCAEDESGVDISPHRLAACDPSPCGYCRCGKSRHISICIAIPIKLPFPDPRMSPASSIYCFASVSSSLMYPLQGRAQGPAGVQGPVVSLASIAVIIVALRESEAHL